MHSLWVLKLHPELAAVAAPAQWHFQHLHAGLSACRHMHTSIMSTHEVASPALQQYQAAQWQTMHFCTHQKGVR